MGMIKFGNRNSQIHDFDGICCGKMHPTDIDGTIDHHDKAWLYWESKYGDTPFPKGQEIYAERRVRDDEKIGKLSAYFVVRHNVSNCEETVYEANSVIERFYTKGRWWRPARAETLKERLNYITGQIDGTEWDFDS